MAEDSIEIELSCPTCKTSWADALIRFNSVLRCQDVRARNEWRDKVSKSGELVCPKCNRGLTRRDVFEAIAKSMMKSSKRSSTGLRLYGNGNSSD